MEIFRTYDIRGKVPDDITENIMYNIGRAAVIFLNCKRLFVGRDCRLSSPALHQALVKGITDQGADVVDIGLCSTPLLYFASSNGPAAMITASHMPKEFNGIKFCRQGALPIGLDTGLAEIKRIFDAGTFPEPKRKGKLSSENFLTEYLKHCLSFAGKIKPLKVVVDAGNGMGGIACSEIFKQLPCKLIPLYFEPDGTFPNHEPNPINPENLLDLQLAVKKHKAELGAAYDADCDRILFVDEHANIITGDKILGLLALHLLRKNKGATILYDLRSTHAVPEVIEKAGGTPIITPVGHALIKPLMKKHKALLGGELSGHFYYSNNQYAESGDITLIHILTMLSEENKPLSELVAPFRKYAHSGEINFEVHDRQAMIQKLESEFLQAKVDRLDGITLSFEDWWFNARPSKNDPVLRLVIEAKNERLLKEKSEGLKRIMESGK